MKKHQQASQALVNLSCGHVSKTQFQAAQALSQDVPDIPLQFGRMLNQVFESARVPTQQVASRDRFCGERVNGISRKLQQVRHLARAVHSKNHFVSRGGDLGNFDPSGSNQVDRAHTFAFTEYRLSSGQFSFLNTTCDRGALCEGEPTEKACAHQDVAGSGKRHGSKIMANDA